MYCNDARTDASAEATANNAWEGERSAGSRSACAVRCVLLLLERAEAKRRGELELMRNEQDDGGQTEID